MTGQTHGHDHFHKASANPEEQESIQTNDACSDTHPNTEARPHHSHNHDNITEPHHPHHHENTAEPHHPHHHENTKAVLNRMNRAIGHMEAVKTMIEDGRDCSEVLIQIAAVRSAINNIGKIILEDHINHCVVDAIETGNEQVLKDLNDAINKFIK